MTPPREPIFNAPAVIVATTLLMVAIHVVRAFLPESVDQQVLLYFAFIPLRYDPSVLAEGAVPGGLAADVWSFVTYAFLHADSTHLTVNMLWHLVFGSAVAWRFGTVRFLLFFLITAAAGAVAHLIAYSGEMVPMIGASAAISGATAAGIRFVFQMGGPLGMFRVQGRAAFRVPAISLVDAFKDRRVVLFLVVWAGLNLLWGAGVGAFGGGQTIAWQAHVGGFLAGLLLFPLFDPVPREPDTKLPPKAFRH